MPLAKKVNGSDNEKQSLAVDGITETHPWRFLYVSIFTLRSRLHEGVYGSEKYFLLKMNTTYVVVLCMDAFLGRINA